MRGWLPLPLGRLELRLHLLLPAAAGLLALLGGDLWLRYLLLLAILLLHELGHAGAALALGGRRTVVRLWPVFGRADVESFGDRREALVALAAPVANLLAALGLALAGGRVSLDLADAPLVDFLFTANLAMGLGNLVPLLPADGGRALQALRR